MQTGELIIIVLLALVVLGPQRLPELARKAGHWAAELRKAAGEITAGLEAEVSEFKQLGDDLKAPLDEASRNISEIGRDVSETGREISQATNKGLEWKGPKPLSGPTPEDAMRDLERIEAESDEGRVGPGEPATSEDEGTETDDEPVESGEEPTG
jgi:sec-independent protein translocase protein TatB